MIENSERIYFMLLTTRFLAHVLCMCSLNWCHQKFMK